jgi:hypothetical protein
MNPSQKAPNQQVHTSLSRNVHAAADSGPLVSFPPKKNLIKIIRKIRFFSTSKLFRLEDNAFGLRVALNLR